MPKKNSPLIRPGVAPDATWLARLADQLLETPPEETDRARAARGSLREFVAQAWHIVEPGTPYVHGWHIDAICEHLEAVTRCEIRDLVLNMPPRHMKSLLVAVFWFCWDWLNHPQSKWLYASYAQGLSTRDSVKCRRLIESAWYQGNWGHIFSFSEDQNLKTRFENNHLGHRIATSVTGQTTGDGGDYLICDDPHNVLQALSDTQREEAIEWWDSAMSTRGNDPATVRRVIVMQRIHERDLAGHVLANGGYEHLVLPAEYEGKVWVQGSPLWETGGTTAIGWSDPRTESGELLWPERFDRASLEKIKHSLGSYAASGQLQQRPSPAGGGIFQRQWWRYYDTAPECDEYIMSWDMSFKNLKDSDYVVGQVWGRLGADCYLMDQARARLDFPGTLAAVRRLADKWPQATAKLVEDKANGSAVIAALKGELVGLIPVTPDGGKESRAAAVSPMVEAGNVYLPDPRRQPWVEGLLEEMAQFPNGVHDDQVDALTQALRRFQTRPSPFRLRIIGVGEQAADRHELPPAHRETMAAIRQHVLGH